MAGQGATSLQRIGSHRRWNQSLYATEMHLSLAWASLLWFHGVWYGLSLFCFHSQLLFLRPKRPKTGFFQNALCLRADILCIHAHFGTYVQLSMCACVSVHRSRQLNNSSAGFVLGMQHHYHFRQHTKGLYVSVRMQSRWTAQQWPFRCPPSSLLAF